MASEGVANSMLVLRSISLVASVVTISLIVTNNFTFEDDDGTVIHLKFQNVMAFRYVLAVAAISVAYGIIQLPFAVYYAVKRKRLIHNAFFPDFDFFGDKVISLLLATAIGDGIGVSYEAKRRLEEDISGVDPSDIDQPFTSGEFKFIDRGIIASSLLAVACLFMAIVSVISSINRSRS